MAGLFQPDDTSSGHLGPHCNISESHFTPASSKGLFKAVQNANLLQVRLLLNAGADIHGKNELGETVLTVALRIREPPRRLGLFRWLMNAGVSVTAIDKVTGRDAILWAAYLNRTPELCLALNAGIADCNISRADRFGYSALHYSVLHNNIEGTAVIADIQRRFDLPLDNPDCHEVSPFLHALRLGYDQCADILKPRRIASDKGVDSGSVWERIGELQGIRLARSQGGSLPVRLPRILSRTASRQSCDSSWNAGHLITGSATANSLHRSGTGRARKEKQVPRIRGRSSASVMERRKNQKSSKSADFSGLEHVSVQVADLRQESPKLACKTKRNVVSQSMPPPMPEDCESPNTGKKSSEKDSNRYVYRCFIPQLFSLYADQQTGSLLPAAQPRPTGTYSFGAMVQATKFAMLLRTKQQKQHIIPQRQYSESSTKPPSSDV